MDYLKIYNCLIINRQNNPISRKDCYCEKHHIIPKSEGGNNENSNLVYLTAREHYIAHLLLVKIYNDWKMFAAVTYMHAKSQTTKGNRFFKYNSRLYQKVRQDFSVKNSEFQIEYCKKHPEHVKKLSEIKKGIKLSQETCKRMSVAKRNMTNETKKKMSECVKIRNKDPEYHEKFCKIMKSVCGSIEYKKKMSEISKKVLSNPEYRKKQSLDTTERWKDSEYKKRVSASLKRACSTEEHKRLVSEAVKQRCKDVKYLKKLSESHRLRKQLNVPKGTTLKQYLKDHPEINIDNLK